MSTALVLFARAPVAGAVKTRLIPALGASGALRVYEALLAHALAVAAAAPVSPRFLYAADRGGSDYFSAHDAARGFAIAEQCATRDLGLRMHAACAEVLRSHPRVLLMGADLVDITSGDLALAAHWLASDAEVVLGPTADGGYWLIGLREADGALFRDIDWSTGGVYAQTIERLVRARRTWRALPLRHDVDDARDLQAHAAALARLGLR